MKKKLKLLLYCTKTKSRLFFDKLKQIFSLGKIKSNNDLNGKIVAECDFEVEEHKETTIDWLCMSLREKIIFGNMCEKAKIDELECYKYANGKPLYAIHIKNLHIFDEPRELNDYDTHIVSACDKGIYLKKEIEKAPQNMMYAYNNDGNKYIVISIQPQWMCLILNHIKDVEVRRVVLKEMLNNE